MKLFATLLALFFCSIHALSQSYPTGNLVAAYPFNGNVKDVSGNGHHAQAYGVSLAKDRFGYTNSAYHFNGTNDYIDTKTSFDYEERTISVWFKSFDNSGTGYNTKSIYDQSANTLIYGSTSAWISEDTLIVRPASEIGEELGKHNVPEYKWQHVVLVREKDSTRAYLNGTLILAGVPGTAPGSTSLAYKYLVLGTDRSRTRRWFNGIVDDLLIYNTALSEEEIQSIYQYGGWPVPQNDISISWISPDDPECGTQVEQSVTIRIKNTGEDTISGFSASYCINTGKGFITEFINTDISTGDSLDYTFETKADMSEEGPFSCVAAVCLTGDINSSNDSVHKVVQNNSFKIVTESFPNFCKEAVGVANVVSVEGGLAPYSYFWTNGDTTAQANGLATGLYQVTVTDNRGCSSSVSVLIGEMGSPQISQTTTISDVSCHGGTDGAIDVNIIGGVEPYSFQWSNGAITEDIFGLTAGPYELIVTDMDTCSNVATFTIEQPQPLQYTPTTTNADCLTDNDGTALIHVSGGIAPYTYLWSEGSTESSVTGLSSGIYTVLFMDNNGCIDSTHISISETNSPEINLKKVTPAVCGVASGALDISISAAGNFEFVWSNGATTEDLQNIPPGEYSIQAAHTDSSCSAIATFTVPSIKPGQTPICFVTVDSVAERNRVVWAEPGEGAILGFHIYRESSLSDIYQLIGWAGFEEQNIFVDSSANPAVKPWRYRITLVDTCGNESELSDMHQTIHLTMNVGLTGEVNLIWGNYQGIDYNSYHIYRYSITAGREKIADIAGSPFIYYNTYTDLEPPEDVSHYVVEINAPECLPSKKAVEYPSVRSNKVEMIQSDNTGLDDFSHGIGNLNLFPNPSPGEITLKLNSLNSPVIQVRIFDLQGRSIRKWQTNLADGQNQITFSLTGNPPGLYYLQLISEAETIIKPFIIE